MEMRYWVGATTCHTQFLLGGYSLGQPGVLMVPFSLERRPPHAAGNTQTHKEKDICVYVFYKPQRTELHRKRRSCFILHCSGKGIPWTLPDRIVHEQALVTLVNAYVSCFSSILNPLLFKVVKLLCYRLHQLSNPHFPKYVQKQSCQRLGRAKRRFYCHILNEHSCLSLLMFVNSRGSRC